VDIGGDGIDEASLFQRARGDGKGNVRRQAQREGLLIPRWRDWWQADRRPLKQRLNLSLERSALQVLASHPELAPAPGDRYEPDNDGGSSLLRARFYAASLHYDNRKSFLNGVGLPAAPVPGAISGRRRQMTVRDEVEKALKAQRDDASV
jgi:hypothetical protein